ncbi:bifunctional phosphopantothenoylcysteine decarboxylase/phosphopantothenate--cysteine ligase CoaBC [Flavihumibacter sp. CACIAM 22H1]|uniref:bifunctional phosphopantothenoylcysteine decarboxylase/phosphopantothenate--cysteine ligase CoaBC n=1 Tax=Flavihumibacter sp. CACIAM 22H1 TaxID=1812911 RepID=UPI0007A8B936|nr:bifunctional phosphopantothenoylcysteine decarboxylase/phosphopantothenate--cysteine ligase CoaBC [Flavihumibacter sp. CACIAM 22H1]KYP14689.1 MAG: phosphopantothenoylcysteine decarboxylase [Flavihumibacter sp. CACIAM 22H1]
MLQGKKILLGISGSIAAYKSISLVRLLIKQGASVQVILSPAARDFVSPLTLSTLSKQEALSDLFEEGSWANHVMLGRSSDLFLIAPLSCNTLAKMAHGHCDNLLLATYLSATCPVWVAPAMDEDMWHHPTTKTNLDLLRSFGNTVIPVNSGELASGLTGEGRMAEPEEILAMVQNYFSRQAVFAGKKALVTAGPTYEPIDPVRFIGNHSSGKMGVAIALELATRGAMVDLVAGPGVSLPNHPGIRSHSVTTAAEMYAACNDRFPTTDLAIMAAAVADYTPVTVAGEKIKKKEEGLDLPLTKTKDILKELGRQKAANQVLVGFALETNNERANALQKLETKNADLIILNSLQDKGAGFGVDTNKITIFDRAGQEAQFPLKSKTALATDIIDLIHKKFYE